MSDSQVTLVGNLVRDAELRYTPNGSPVVTFGLAVNRRWQNKTTQQWEEQVSFFDVTCWRDLAENVASTVSKGNRVIVTGRLEQRSWEAQDGSKRSRVEVVADEVGPSLKWATADIVRVERSDTSAGSGGGSGDPWSTPREPFSEGWDAEEPFVASAELLWEL